jgi:hypothetical protein
MRVLVGISFEVGEDGDWQPSKARNAFPLVS